ncbi:MAG: M15 family metallopeptidase [Patescibacteria group bacterium]
MKELKFLDKKTINSILGKMGKSRKIKDLRIISFPRLYNYLNKKEIELIENFLKLNPGKYGFKGKFFGIKKAPKNLGTIKEQYLPKPVYLAFRRMNKALEDETGRKLLIDSGYRSPACQTVLFLRSLKLHKFNFSKTAKRIAFPGYSEHGNPERQAIDFITVEGVPSDKKPSGFEKTKEFKWLMKNADRFGFYLSYPKNNKDGIIYEPWHWRFGG